MPSSVSIFQALGPRLRLAWLAAVFLCLPLPRAFCTDESLPEKPKTYLVGIPSDNFPYAYTDNDGKLTGFAVTLFEAVAREASLDYKFIVGPAAETHARFKRGEIDILAIFSHSTERDAYIDFTVPFLRLQGALFISDANRERFKKIADLKGQRIAIVGIGSTGEQLNRNRELGMSIEYASSGTEALRWVSEGRADATFLSRLTGFSAIRDRRIPNLTIIAEKIPEFEVRQCIAIPKDNPRLLAKLNEALALIKSSHEYDDIYQRWFVGIDTPLFSRDQLILWSIYVLAGISIFVTWALLRQRRLHRRLLAQGREIIQQAGLLRALYDNIPMGVIIFGRDTHGSHLVTLNRHAGQLIGLSDNAALSTHIDQLPWPETWSKLAQRWTDTWPTIGQPVHQEIPVDVGRKIVLDVVRVALGESGSTEQRLCVLVEDITERKRAGDEVAQGRRLRAIGELVGGIAHEFNNLMTPLLLQANEVKLDRPDDPPLHASMDIIINTTTRAAELTRRLLTFGRRDESKAEFLNIADTVANCCALARPGMDLRITWEIEISKSLPRIEGSTTDIQQVLLNLILNARDALLDRLNSASPNSDWKARLRLAARVHQTHQTMNRSDDRPAPAGWLELIVEDNGTGMDAATQERIFEPFFTTKEVGKGTGLGLATTWSLINKAGGEILVDSAPGQGARFHVWLPYSHALNDATPPTPTKPSDARTRTKRIFVIEDENAVARAITLILKRIGHTFEHSNNGLEALERLKGAASSKWDTILLDLNLPGTDGLSIARSLRAQGYAGRIVLMSGRIQNHATDEPITPEINTRLAKPFSAEELVTALEA